MTPEQRELSQELEQIRKEAAIAAGEVKVAGKRYGDAVADYELLKNKWMVAQHEAERKDPSLKMSDKVKQAHYRAKFADEFREMKIAQSEKDMLETFAKLLNGKVFAIQAQAKMIDTENKIHNKFE